MRNENRHINMESTSLSPLDLFTNGETRDLSYTISYDEHCGRYLTSTKDIKPGEIILVEKVSLMSPILDCSSCPNNPTECGGFHKNIDTTHIICPHATCLTCSKVHFEQIISSCSKCRWPVCDNDGLCENNPIHGANECQIFVKNNIPPLLQPNRYQMIQFLRFCLLYYKDYNEFQQLLELQSIGCENDTVASLTEKSYGFINEICDLKKISYSLLQRIIGICLVNSFAGDATFSTYSRRCTLLFKQLSLLNHSCVPNTRLIFLEKSPKKSVNKKLRKELFGELRASVFIPKGTAIMGQYVNIIQTTCERNRSLWENWGFICSCIRCSDPSEFGTHFSSIRCTECQHGYLLPINLTRQIYNNRNLIYTCSNIGCRCNFSMTEDKYNEMYQQTSLEMHNIFSSFVACEANHMLAMTMETPPCDLNCWFTLYQMDHKVQKFETIFHKNHHIIISVKYKIIEFFIKNCWNVEDKINKCEKIENFQIENSKINEFSQFDVKIALTESMCHHCSDLLRLCDVFNPGLSTYRGVLLYFWVVCLQRLFKVKGQGCRSFGDKHIFLDRVREGIDILRLEPDDSPYQLMAHELCETLQPYLNEED